MELVPGVLTGDAAGNLAALAARAAGAPTGVIHLADGDTLRLAGGSGLPPSWSDAGSAPAGPTLAGLVVTRGTLVVRDVVADSRVPIDAPVRAAGGGAYVGCPILDPGGTVAGVCAVFDYRPRQWSTADVAAVAEAARAATALTAVHELGRRLRRREGTVEALLDVLPETARRAYHAG